MHIETINLFFFLFSFFYISGIHIYSGCREGGVQRMFFHFIILFLSLSTYIYITYLYRNFLQENIDFHIYYFIISLFYYLIYTIYFIILLLRPIHYE